MWAETYLFISNEINDGENTTSVMIFKSIKKIEYKQDYWDMKIQKQLNFVLIFKWHRLPKNQEQFLAYFVPMNIPKRRRETFFKKIYLGILFYF